MYAIGGGVGILAFAAVIFGVVVFIRFRRIKLMRGGFIFAGRGLRRKKNNGQEERLVYDAAVYHHDDEVEFVDERLRPRLENHPNNFRLCLPLIRDFRLGVKRLNGLRESLVASMCAVFVISHAFVIDARCRQALEVACDYLHRDDLGPPHIKQTDLILILLDPVLLENLPEAIRVLVDRLITLEWNNLDEERCWKRLEQSLHDFEADQGNIDNTDETIIRIAKEVMDVDLPLSAIDRSHRIRRQKPLTDSAPQKPRAIIVKLSSYRYRQMLFRNRKKLKDAKGKHKGISMFEDLTDLRRALLWEAFS
ncbi:uncharacterized protein [Diadema antillarum]|uniref:uncharacterized protein n=1 Tax=Diadema antillarum TaxID=105358 RepID=UPI003A8C83D4